MRELRENKPSSGKVLIPFLLAIIPFVASLQSTGVPVKKILQSEQLKQSSYAAISPVKIANACKAYKKFKDTGKKGKIRISKAQLKAERKNKKSKYDIEGDFLTSVFEAKAKTNRLKKDSDKDGLTDSQELCDTRTDPTDPDSDNDGILDGFDPDTGSGGDDTLCSDNGDTTGFGILPELTGNISRGTDKYNSTCIACHPSAQGVKGAHLEYPALSAALSGFPMFLNLPAADVADITAYVNADRCTAATPTPTPLPPGSTPTPGPTPPPSAGNCDSGGNTTAFGIPSPLIGNIASGSSQYQNTCAGCHPSGSKGANYLFPALKSALNGPPMFITNLSDQQIANLTAYLNQNNCSGNGTPSPTPPQSPAEIGHDLFISMCSSCHSHGERGWTQNKIQHAFQDADQMEVLPWRPTTQQYYYLVQYFLTLGGDD